MKYSIIIILLLVSSIAQAELTFTAYPYIAYSSETRLMLGAFSFAGFDLPVQEEKAAEVDILANTIYTQNKQFLIVTIPRIRYDTWTLEADLLFQNWPDTFYGIGNQTDPDISEDFSARYYSSSFILRNRLSKYSSIAVIADLGWHEITKIEELGMLASSGVNGIDDSFFMGTGMMLRYDTTDESYFPERGLKLEARQIWYSSVMGSDFDFQESSLDARGYFSLFPNQVLALQSDLQIDSSEVPFYLYPELGKRLRAYDSKRFIDKSRISQRLEYRLFPFSGDFSKRIGFVGFVETGQVSKALERIRFADWHWSAGGGIRFSIVPQERLNLRADVGFGKDSFNVIINAREVF